MAVTKNPKSLHENQNYNIVYVHLQGLRHLSRDTV